MLLHIVHKLGANIPWFFTALPRYSKHRKYCVNGDKIGVTNIINRCENDVYLLYALLTNPANKHKHNKILKELSPSSICELLQVYKLPLESCIWLASRATYQRTSINVVHMIKLMLG